MLKERGLSDKGRKAELEARLAEADLQAVVGADVQLSPGQLAVAREARNEACSGMLRLPAPVQLVAMSQLSVVQLWRARAVSRHFYRWGTEALEGLPQMVSVGGARVDRSDPAEPKIVAGPVVEVLSLATLRWSMAAASRMPPALPAPRAKHVVAVLGGGRVVAVGGWNVGGADPMPHLQKRGVQWVPGSAAWAALPPMAVARSGAAAVALPDGRLLVAGGVITSTFHTSVEVLAADGSGWAAAAPSEWTTAQRFAAVLTLRLWDALQCLALGWLRRRGCYRTAE